MSGLNHKNVLSNIYSSGVDNIFLKKKIGKNNSSISKITNSPLFYKDNIICSVYCFTIDSMPIHIHIC